MRPSAMCGLKGRRRGNIFVGIITGVCKVKRGCLMIPSRRSGVAKKGISILVCKCRRVHYDRDKYFGVDSAFIPSSVMLL